MTPSLNAVVRDGSAGRSVSRAVATGPVEELAGGAAPANEPPPDVLDPYDLTPLDGLQDEALMTALRELAGEHEVVSWNEARRLVFGEIDNVRGWVRDVYTERRVEVDEAPPFPEDFDVEHTWPRARGVEGTDAETDLHHLFPADSEANTIRNKWEFGEVTKVRNDLGESLYGLDEIGERTFEPPAEHKGNVARALFYVATVYDLNISADEEANLRLWNEQDPVDDAERKRNDEVSRYQRNRNPFVDDPSLADRISDF
jgi:deoxyribonuclease I